MRCPSCSFENRDGVRFCENCGDALAVRASCTTCGQSNRPGVTFCENCGTRLADPVPVPLAPPRADSGRSGGRGPGVAVAALLLTLMGGGALFAAGLLDGGQNQTAFRPVTTAGQAVPGLPAGDGPNGTATTTANSNESNQNTGDGGGTNATVAAQPGSISTVGPSTTTAAGQSTSSTSSATASTGAQRPSEPETFDDWSAPGCPVGICLTYTSSGWDDTTIRWCQVGTSNHINDLRRTAADAVSWWEVDTPIDFVEDCGNEQIRIVWRPPPPPDPNNPNRSTTLGSAEALRPGTTLLTITMYDYASMGPNGWNDPVQVLAHELGHALGLGHSEHGEALMYPTIRSYCSPIQTPAGDQCRTPGLRLSQEEIDGIDRLYGTAQTARKFFDYVRFDLVDPEAANTVTLPYPEGSTGQAAMCFVDTFKPTWPSAGWDCRWSWDNSRREVTFEVTAFAPGGIEGTQVSGFVVVLDTSRVFVDSYPFSIDHQDFGSNWATDAAAQIPGVYQPPGSVTLLSITGYDPGDLPLDPLGYHILASEGTGYRSHVQVVSRGGQFDSVLRGVLLVLRPGSQVNLQSTVSRVVYGNPRTVVLPAVDDDPLLLFDVTHQYMPFTERIWTAAQPRFETGSDFCNGTPPCVWNRMFLSGGEARSWVEYVTVSIQAQP